MDAYLRKLTNSINYSFQHNSFPQELKLSEVIPLYKTLDPSQKENYRPVSLLPHTFKVFERIIHKQITNYVRDELNKSITGFRKSHGRQHSLVVMLEKWKRTTDMGECVSALFIDLLKAFDIMPLKPRSNDCKTEGIWLFWRNFEAHAKLCKKQKTKIPD